MTSDLAPQLDMVTRLYQASTLPAAVVDENLGILWINDAANRLHPCLKVPGGLHQWIPSGSEELAQKLRQGSPVDFPVPAIAGPHTILHFLPYLEGDDFLFALCVFNHPPAIQVAKESNFSQSTTEVLINTLNTQIRDPVHIIFSIVSMLSQSPQFLEDPKSGQMLGRIRKMCYKLLRACSNITELTRYTNGLSALSLKRADLSGFVSSICEACAMLIKTLDIPFTFQVPKQPVITLIDPEKLSVALLNILLNACRFSKECNEINLNCTVSDSQVIISVKDSGYGIPDSYLSRVFDPYFSFDPAGELYADAGIGLSLVKFIITEHGGTVALNSVEHVGTTVVFTIPIRDTGDYPEYVQASPLEYLQDKFSPVNVIFSDLIEFRT
ncbi:sensor histidine kinase [Zongyangia hominis]|uniref:histidine kinase n=1 Tax=Zongyangia hominis TaxID=2763677 RepID=A0A926EFC6_9FIRM|nr:HAMP domain-containing sensor histidine kinase [Zongyangia hominis]MBC8571041.1 HAMP domain-containing histidine kinase [Zongyangia hominis]